MTNLARYFILGIISVIFFANLPVFATPVFAKFVIPPPHPHAIYWAVLGILILTILCMFFSPHREDDAYH
jgi:hypothetical protein